MNAVLLLALLVSNIATPLKIRDRYDGTMYREQNLVDDVHIDSGKLVVRVEVDSTDWIVVGEIETRDPNAPGPMLTPNNLNVSLGGAAHLWELTWFNFSTLTPAGGMSIVRITLSKPGAREIYEYSVVIDQGKDGLPPPPSKSPGTLKK